MVILNMLSIVLDFCVPRLICLYLRGGGRGRWQRRSRGDHTSPRPHSSIWSCSACRSRRRGRSCCSSGSCSGRGERKGPRLSAHRNRCERRAEGLHGRQRQISYSTYDRRQGCRETHVAMTNHSFWRKPVFTILRSESGIFVHLVDRHTFWNAEKDGGVTMPVIQTRIQRVPRLHIMPEGSSKHIAHLAHSFSSRSPFFPCF